MSIEKTANVCLTCRHFNDHESQCQRFPPQVRVESVDDDGERFVSWEQPVIDIEWSTTCGEWSADIPEETPWQRCERVGQRINEWKEAGKIKD